MRHKKGRPRRSQDTQKKFQKKKYGKQQAAAVRETKGRKKREEQDRIKSERESASLKNIRKAFHVNDITIKFNFSLRNIIVGAAAADFILKF